MPLLPLLILLSAAGSCRANYSELGRCPDRPRQASLDPGRLAGVWYEQMRYFDPGFRARCTRWSLTPAAGGTVRLNETRLDAADGSRYETIDQLRPAGGLLRSTRFDYMVVSTDYDGYSVLQLCRQYDGFNARTVLVLTRQRRPDQRKLDELLRRLQREGLLTDRLVPTPQADCPAA